MVLFPAIDILDGRAVRLVQGDRNKVTDYGDPLVFAEKWAEAGAQWLHIVDLSGAFSGESGIDSVIGTLAISDPVLFALTVYEFPEKIVAGIDARGGMLAVKGWTETTETSAVSFGKKCRRMGISCALFTDISKDGAMAGANVAESMRMQKETELKIIASGGVSSMADLVNLEDAGIYGAVLGKAIYDGAVDLKEAVGRFPQG